MPGRPHVRTERDLPEPSPQRAGDRRLDEIGDVGPTSQRDEINVLGQTKPGQPRARERSAAQEHHIVNTKSRHRGQHVRDEMVTAHLFLADAELVLYP